MYNSDYWLNLRELWTHFPTRSMAMPLKWYYLVQFAFWIQQIIVVNIEERRKDYSQMLTHHIITCFLVFGSYGIYQTKVGNVILCLMDVIDIILPVSEQEKLRHAKLCANRFPSSPPKYSNTSASVQPAMSLSASSYSLGLSPDMFFTSSSAGRSTQSSQPL